MSWLSDLNRVDSAVYNAVAATPTPALDEAMRRLSSAANYSRLSLASAALLGTFGGQKGRRAAVSGLESLAVTALVANAIVKPLGGRRRPDQDPNVPPARRISLPGSHSFPSGHTAAAVSFAAGVGRVMPSGGVALYSLAALVGYSRVHTGVHYPGDVLAGALLGVLFADIVSSLRDRGR
jgi:undecaprenyl-diphosphatase